MDIVLIGVVFAGISTVTGIISAVAAVISLSRMR